MTPVTTSPADAIAARVHEARERLVPIASEYPFVPRYFAQPEGLLQHFVDEGPPAASPLLFVHGNPTWSFAWRRAIVELRDRFRCVAPDHVGCGLSDKPQRYAYRLEQHVKNLERLVHELGLRRITLVMHDWGGPIGLGFARRNPDRITRLVVLNTAAFPSRRMPRRLAVCRVPVVGTLAVRGLNAFARGATLMAVENPLSDVARRGYLLPYDSWRNRVATLAFVEDIPMKAGHPSFAELRAIEDALPTFRDRRMAILWGERDWCFTPRFREEWERRFPDARSTRFEHAGHYVFEDAAEGVVRELSSFLEGGTR